MILNQDTQKELLSQMCFYSETKSDPRVGINSTDAFNMIIGFGYPEIPYARGTQKDRGRKFIVIARSLSNNTMI